MNIVPWVPSLLCNNSYEYCMSYTPHLAQVALSWTIYKPFITIVMACITFAHSMLTYWCEKFVM